MIYEARLIDDVDLTPGQSGADRDFTAGGIRIRGKLRGNELYLRLCYPIFSFPYPLSARLERAVRTVWKNSGEGMEMERKRNGKGDGE